MRIMVITRLLWIVLLFSLLRDCAFGRLPAASWVRSRFSHDLTLTPSMMTTTAVSCTPKSCILTDAAVELRVLERRVTTFTAWLPFEERVQLLGSA